MAQILVTGGSGYFGEALSRRLLEQGHRVRILDLNVPAFTHPKLEFLRCDICDPKGVADACADMDIIHHNVAQVPLAKDKALFRSVNFDGMRILLDAARGANVGKLVYTSTSAVFGAAKELPVTVQTPADPAEAYGRAKYEAERLCAAAVPSGLDVTIIRPRTILGHGRLGILQILFDWVERGDPVPVFSGGDNRYQFVHADDLADACIAAGFRAGPATYNVGSSEYGTMRNLLASLIVYAQSSSKIVSVPMSVMSAAMNLTSALGLSPLGPYHALMYGREMFFDIEPARRDLNYHPKYSDKAALAESYDFYIANRERMKAGAGRSHHQSSLRKRILTIAPWFLRIAPALPINR